MVISSGKHDLLTNFVDVFKAANNWSKEYIWSVVCTPNGGGTGWGSKLPGVMLTNKAWGIYNGWGYYLPTKELYDSFETGDLRREATILKPGDKFQFLAQNVHLQKTAVRLRTTSSKSTWNHFHTPTLFQHTLIQMATTEQQTSMYH
jgi:hypothetical protein